MSRFDDIAQGGGLVSTSYQASQGMALPMLLLWIASRWPWMTSAEARSLGQAAIQSASAGGFADAGQDGSAIGNNQIPAPPWGGSPPPPPRPLDIGVIVTVTDPITGDTQEIYVVIQADEATSTGSVRAAAEDEANRRLTDSPSRFAGSVSPGSPIVESQIITISPR